MLMPSKWKNSIQDVWVKKGASLNTDHNPVYAIVKAKLRKYKQTSNKKTKNYAANEEQQLEFNNHIKEGKEQREQGRGNLMGAIQEAAEATLKKKEKKEKPSDLGTNMEAYGVQSNTEGEHKPRGMERVK